MELLRQRMMVLMGEAHMNGRIGYFLGPVIPAMLRKPLLSGIVLGNNKMELSVMMNEALRGADAWPVNIPPMPR
jgi:hypothetical protein